MDKQSLGTLSVCYWALLLFGYKVQGSLIHIAALYYVCRDFLGQSAYYYLRIEAPLQRLAQECAHFVNNWALACLQRDSPSPWCSSNHRYQKVPSAEGLVSVCVDWCWPSTVCKSSFLMGKHLANVWGIVHVIIGAFMTLLLSFLLIFN